MPKVIKFKNGATLIFNKHNLNQSTAFEIGITAGSYVEEVRGLAHFFEHMLFASNNKYSKEELNKIKGELFLGLNARTHEDGISVTAYETNENIAEKFELIGDMLSGAKFTLADIEAEKKIVEKEILQLSSTYHRRVLTMLMNNIYEYENHNSDVIGTAETINTITGKDLQKFKDKYVCGENLVMSISSNLPEMAIVKLVEKHIVNKLPKGEKNTSFMKDKTINSHNNMLGLKISDEKICEISLVIPVDNANDFAYLLPGLLSSESGEFINLFRHKNNLCYSANVSRVIKDKDGLIFFDMATSSNHANDVLNTFVKYTKKMQKGISKQEFDKFITDRIRTTQLDIETPGDKALSNYANYCSGDEFYSREGYLKFLKSLTYENFNKQVKQFFNFKSINMGLVSKLKLEDYLTPKDILNKIYEPKQKTKAE